MTWVVVNIGCIECGVSSAIVGVFDAEEDARAVCDRLGSVEAMTWREGGQNAYEAFPLPEKRNEAAEDYLDALAGLKLGIAR